jgi:hypothetical protein
LTVARKETVRLVDDVDGSEAAETVEFGVDGKAYEIDLSTDNAARLRDALAPFVSAGRRASTGRNGRRAGSSSNARPSSDRERNQAIREWAIGRGMKVSERGRISSEVLEAYARENGDVRTGTGTATITLAAG